MELERKGGEQAGEKERGRRVGGWVGGGGRKRKQRGEGMGGGREEERAEENFQKKVREYPSLICTLILIGLRNSHNEYVLFFLLFFLFR